MSCGTFEAAPRRRAGIIQSNYIPWKGYFDFIDSVDEFVILDDVQYTRRDWRNRNVIKTPQGLKWLTIPVDVSGRYNQTIRETRISASKWVREHLATLQHVYARAPFFEEEWAWLRPLYESCEGIEHLSEVNEAFLHAICKRLEITTPLRRSSEFDAPPGKNERLIAICRRMGASEYLSGPAARAYMDEDLWLRSGVRVRYKSYGGYPEYPQMYGEFEHGVSIIDLLFCTGPDARRHFKSASELEPADV
jgi:hypothetical protein